MFAAHNSRFHNLTKTTVAISTAGRHNAHSLSSSFMFTGYSLGVHNLSLSTSRAQSAPSISTTTGNGLSPCGNNPFPDKTVICRCIVVATQLLLRLGRICNLLLYIHDVPGVVGIFFHRRCKPDHQFGAIRGAAAMHTAGNPAPKG